MAGPKSIRGKVALVALLGTILAAVAIVAIVAFSAQAVVRNMVASSLEEHLDKAQEAVEQGAYEAAVVFAGSDLLQVVDENGQVIASSANAKGLPALANPDDDDTREVDKLGRDDDDDDKDDDDDDKAAKQATPTATSSGNGSSGVSASSVSARSSASKSSGSSEKESSKKSPKEDSGEKSSKKSSKDDSDKMVSTKAEGKGSKSKSGSSQQKSKAKADDDDDDDDDEDVAKDNDKDDDDDDAKADDDDDDDDDNDDDRATKGKSKSLILNPIVRFVGIERAYAAGKDSTTGESTKDASKDGAAESAKAASKDAAAAESVKAASKEAVGESAKAASKNAAATESTKAVSKDAVGESAKTTGKSATGVSADASSTMQGPEPYLDMSDALGDDGPYLVVKRNVNSPDGPVTLVATTSMAPALQALHAALQLLVVVLLAVLGFVVFFAWRLTAHTLRPVEQMRASVEAIGVDDLSARVPVPENDRDLAPLARTFNEMLERIEKSVNEQHRFVSDASHELKSPVAASGIILETLREHPEAVDLSQALSDLAAENERLATIVQDLLALARQDEGRVHVEKAPADLYDVLYEQVNALRARSSVEVDTSGMQLVVCTTDAELVGHVARNLLDNAARYARDRVKVSCSSTEEHVLLTVSDDGPGIPEEDRERVFGRFVRLENSRTRKEGSTGLGLAVVQGTVESLGGRVWFGEPELGGATAYVELPL